MTQSCQNIEFDEIYQYISVYQYYIIKQTTRLGDIHTFRCDNRSSNKVIFGNEKFQAVAKTQFLLKHCNVNALTEGLRESPYSYSTLIALWSFNWFILLLCMIISKLLKLQNETCEHHIFEVVSLLHIRGSCNLLCRTNSAPRLSDFCKNLTPSIHLLLSYSLLHTLSANV